MIKHYYIKIEGDLEKTDFNYYCQTGAQKHRISAIYVNGNTRDVELNAEGSGEDLDNYVQFLENGPLKPYIYTFKVDEKEVQNIQGFVSRREHVDPKKGIFTKLFSKKKNS
jgi:acylphosphatase